jgi:hypothetical protein
MAPECAGVSLDEVSYRVVRHSRGTCVCLASRLEVGERRDRGHPIPATRGVAAGYLE